MSCKRCNGNNFYFDAFGKKIVCDCSENTNSTDPKHYHLKIEPWDFCIANDLDFFEGNIVKYISRWRQKGGVADLDKAIAYLQKMRKEHLNGSYGK